MTDLTNIFKVLSDETRLRMLMLLHKEALCVCELCGILELSQPKISKNLGKLRDMNIVADERKEKFVFYTLKGDNPMLMAILDELDATIDMHPKLLEDRARLSEKEKYLNQCTILALT